MDTLPRYYTILFNAVDAALVQMDDQNYGLATRILIDGMRQAEEAYMVLPEDEF